MNVQFQKVKPSRFAVKLFSIRILSMTDEEREKMRTWVNNWKETGKFLENLRREEIRKSILSDSIKAFDNAFKSAIYLNKPKPTSGFVEFYKILKKSK